MPPTQLSTGKILPLAWNSAFSHQPHSNQMSNSWNIGEISNPALPPRGVLEAEKPHNTLKERLMLTFKYKALLFLSLSENSLSEKVPRQSLDIKVLFILIVWILRLYRSDSQSPFCSPGPGRWLCTQVPWRRACGRTPCPGELAKSPSVKLWLRYK